MSSALVQGVINRAMENKKKNLASSILQSAVRARNVRENILPNILVEEEATNLIIKSSKVADLLEILKSMKSAGIYIGRTTGLKKAEIVNRLQSLNFDFSSLAGNVRNKRTKSAFDVPYRKYGSLKKAVNRYEKSGNRQLEKAIKKEKKQGKPTKSAFDVPYKKYGRTSTLVKKYEKSGNKQLERAIKKEDKKKEKEAIKLLKTLNSPPKRRGRPPKN